MTTRFFILVLLGLIGAASIISADPAKKAAAMKDPDPAGRAELHAAARILDSERFRFRERTTPFYVDQTETGSLGIYLHQENEYALLIAGKEGVSELAVTIEDADGKSLPLEFRSRKDGTLLVIAIKGVPTGNYRVKVSSPAGVAGVFWMGYGYR